jgi:hypothetical protein
LSKSEFSVDKCKSAVEGPKAELTATFSFISTEYFSQISDAVYAQGETAQSAIVDLPSVARILVGPSSVGITAQTTPYWFKVLEAPEGEGYEATLDGLFQTGLQWDSFCGISADEYNHASYATCRLPSKDVEIWVKQCVGGVFDSWSVNHNGKEYSVSAREDHITNDIFLESCIDNECEKAICGQIRCEAPGYLKLKEKASRSEFPDPNYVPKAFLELADQIQEPF